MRVKWLRPGPRLPLSQGLRSSTYDRASWASLAQRRLISGDSGQSLALDQKFGDSFFPHQPLSLVERRLLGKARLNGIDTLEKLGFEADLRLSRDIGSRMTDKIQHRQDLDLWRLLLEFNQHRHGVNGAKIIWKAMMFRGKPVELESRNRNASDLVQSIITSAVEDIKFLKDLSLDCVRRNIFHDRLFIWVVGTLLLLHPKAAPTLTILLKESCFQDKNDLLEVLAIACQSAADGAVEAFCQVRSLLPDFRVYNDVMPIVWAARRPSDAFVLHRYLLAQGDLPKTFEVLKPFVRHLQATNGDLESFLRGLAAADVSFEAQIRRYRTYLGTSPSTESNEPRKPSDETIARTLATFPFDFAMQSLRFFGLIEVGPLSVREIVLSSADRRALKEKFEALEEYNIDTGSSAYVRLLKKMSINGFFEEAKKLAESDMHHDEYEDRDLQRRLLKQYYMNGSHQQMNSTLTILHRGRVDLVTQRRSINLLLRSAIAEADWRRTLNLIDHISHEGYEVEHHTLDLLVQRALRPDSYNANSFDQIGFLIGVLQRLLAAGNAIQPARWLRPLIGLGRQGRLDELDKLSLWLAEWYSSTSREPHRFDGDLSKLFTPGLQRALISWSFTKTKWEKKTSAAIAATEVCPGSFVSQTPWLWGARLLRKLHDEYSMHLSLPEVQEVFFSEVRRMFHARGSYRRVSNQVYAYAKDGMVPHRYLETWNELWGDLIVPSEKLKTIEAMPAALSPRRHQSSHAQRSKSSVR